MEFLSNYRQRHEASVLKGIEAEADNIYTLEEYKGKLFIAIQGVPTIGFEDNTPATEIVKKLKERKESYVEYKKSSNSRLRIAAAL